MEVILLEKVHNLGELGDKVRVRPGYGRNYLVPQGKAVPATEENLAAFEQRRAELERAYAEALAAAQARAAAFEDYRVTVPAKAGAEGRLFGSVGPGDIAAAATAAGQPLERSEVRLGEGPLRTTGEHTVQLHLHTDVDAEITVEVVPQG